MAIDAGAWVQSLSRLKRYIHIGVSDNSKDTFLEELINASYKILEAYMGKAVLSATYTEYYDGDDLGKLVLRKWPTISITSIHVDDTRSWDAAYLCDANGYVLDTELGIVEFFSPAAGVTGPQWFSCGIKNVKVVYVAGWASLPAELVQAGVEHVAWMFNRSGTEGYDSQSLGQKSESYADEFIPLHIKQKLDFYRERGR